MGPRMLASLEYVATHPGCSKSDAGRCGGDGPLYSDAVARLVRQELVAAEQSGRYRYQLSITARGKGALDAGRLNAREKDLDRLVSGYNLSQVTEAALELAEHLAHVYSSAESMDVVMALRRRREKLRAARRPRRVLALPREAPGG